MRECKEDKVENVGILGRKFRHAANHPPPSPYYNIARDATNISHHNISDGYNISTDDAIERKC